MISDMMIYRILSTHFCFGTEATSMGLKLGRVSSGTIRFNHLVNVNKLDPSSYTPAARAALIHPHQGYFVSVVSAGGAWFGHCEGNLLG